MAEGENESLGLATASEENHWRCQENNGLGKLLLPHPANKEEEDCARARSAESSFRGFGTLGRQAAATVVDACRLLLPMLRRKICSVVDDSQAPSGRVVAVPESLMSTTTTDCTDQFA